MCLAEVKGIYYMSLDEMGTNPSGESSTRISDCCWRFWASPIARAALKLLENQAASWLKNHLENYEFVNGKNCPIYETEN